jgi:hypothetical protein
MRWNYAGTRKGKGPIDNTRLNNNSCRPHTRLTDPQSHPRLETRTPRPECVCVVSNGKATAQGSHLAAFYLSSTLPSRHIVTYCRGIESGTSRKLTVASFFFRGCSKVGETVRIVIFPFVRPVQVRRSGSTLFRHYEYRRSVSGWV